METRWFIGFKSAEGDAFFPVELTKPEFEAVTKFIKAQGDAIYEPYCGGFGLYEENMCFATKDQALEFIREVLL